MKAQLPNNLFTISQIADTIQGTVDGDANLTIRGVCDIQNGKPGHISYIASSQYEKHLKDTLANAVIVHTAFVGDAGNKTLIRINNPAVRFIDVMNLFHPQAGPNGQIHPKAVIAQDAQVGSGSEVGPHSVVERKVRIGENVKIGAGVAIGTGTTIGDNTVIHANVSIYHDVAIGSSCIIDSGSVLGSDGFGLVSDSGKHHKIPHLGSVKIENNVWVGSNCCIDRGTFKDTIISEGSKLDNQIQIAHNVVIGKCCVISGQSAIAGSTVLEDNVTIAGQVGIAGHLTIGKGTVIASKSAVYQSLKPSAFVSGVPAREHKNRLRQDVIINQLPDLLKRVRKLEQEFLLAEEN